MEDLQSTIETTLQSKKDTTQIRSATTPPSGALRTPPVVKCRRTLKGHFGKVTSLVRFIELCYFRGDTTRFSHPFTTFVLTALVGGFTYHCLRVTRWETSPMERSHQQ